MRLGFVGLAFLLLSSGINGFNSYDVRSNPGYYFFESNTEKNEINKENANYEEEPDSDDNERYEQDYNDQFTYSDDAAYDNIYDRLELDTLDKE